jgi:serine phosphatase RsbU (regulator of sigma subunit)
VVGAMRFVSAESKRRFDDEDVRLAQAAADRVAEALDNAWLTEQQRHIAATLQGALLPPRLPEIEGLSVAVRYWAAGGASQVGGDFYDVFGIGDGRWAIVIGDVCGTGPNAAAVIAIARHTIRAAAKHGADHRAVLDWLNDALHAGNRDLFCTAVFSTLERIDGRAWRYTAVAGGHPLPVVVRADGTATTVGAPGTLLGVMPAIEATSTEVNLGPGDTLVLYTDGLTDVAPPHDLEPAALLQLMSQAAATDGSADDVAARLGALVESVLPIPERNDDLALVVVRAKPDEHEAAEGDENR